MCMPFFPHSLLILFIVFLQNTTGGSLPARCLTPMTFVPIPFPRCLMEPTISHPGLALPVSVLFFFFFDVLTLLLPKYNLSFTWVPFLYFHIPCILQGMHQPIVVDNSDNDLLLGNTGIFTCFWGKDPLSQELFQSGNYNHHSQSGK